MRSVSISLVAIILLLMPYVAFAQLVEYVGSTLWSGINDAEVVGANAFCAFTNGLVVLNLTDSWNPSIVCKREMPGARAIDVAGNYAYVAGGAFGLQVVNITNPSDPVLMGNCPVSGVASDVFIYNNHAYITDGDLKIIDISDCTAPQLIGSYVTPNNAVNVFVASNYAYVADGWSFQILNVTDPSSPLLMSSFSLPDRASGICVIGNYAYIADSYYGGLQIINISDRSNPVFAGNIFPPGYSINAIVVSGSYAYVAAGLSSFWAGLDVINIDDPTNPVLAGNCMTWGVPTTVFKSGSYVYMAEDLWLQIVHAGNPSSPVVAGEYVAGIIWDLAVADTVAYVGAAQADLRIVDIADPANPEPIASYETMYGDVQNAVISGNYAYLLIGTSLEIVNISDPHNPIFMGSFSGIYAGDLFVIGGYAYAVDRWSFQIVDVTNPTNPVEAGQFDLNGHYPSSVAVFGNYAYITDIHGLEIYNIADPYHSFYAGVYSSNGFVSIFITDGIAFLGGYHSLIILSLADPVHPTQLSNYTAYDTPRNIYVSNHYAYLAEAESGIEIVDVSNLSSPAYLASRSTANARNICAAGEYIYVADSIAFQILKLGSTEAEESPNSPDVFSLSQNYPNPFNAQITIQYSLPKQSMVTIDIFDILGRKIETLIEGIMPAGEHQSTWDACGQSSGIYFYRIKAGNYIETKKMALLK